MAVKPAGKSPLAANVAKALKDGKLTDKEWKGLEAEAKKDGLSISERRQLRQTAWSNPEALDEGAKKASRAFTQAQYTDAFGGKVKVTGEAGGLSDPAPISGSAGKYAQVQGKLFVGGAKLDDVVQGNLGNCWVMAPLASMAQQRPDLVKKLVRQEADGSFTVTLHPPYSKGIELKVDRDLFVNQGGLAFGRSRTNGELWPAVVEKAIAQHLGGFDTLGRGGHGEAAIALLTGMKTASLDLRRVPKSDVDQLFNDIKTGLEKKKDLAVIATRSEFEAPQLHREGLVPQHAYTLVGVSERDGVKYATLRNPWGEIEPSGDGKDDGTFELPFDKVMQLFGDLSATVG